MTTGPIICGVAALGLMSLAGAQRAAQWIEHTTGRLPWLWGEPLALGCVAYAVPMALILIAHSLGHRWACRRHGLTASWPYLIPLPIPLTGHGGSFVSCDTPRSRKALFDVAVAGPLAGFLMTLPIMVIGLYLSVPVPLRKAITAARYRMPEFMQWASGPMFGSGVDVVVHPLAWAAWVGLLVTAINLLPFLQLDGGQVVLALWPRAWFTVSLVTGIVVAWLGWGRPSWTLFLVAMVIMAPFCGLKPAALADSAPVGSWRVIVALVCAAVFLGSVTPINVR